MSRAATWTLAIAVGAGPIGAATAEGLDLGGAVTFGDWSPYATRYVVARTVCAWSSGPERHYRVIADTFESPGAFRLVGDLGDTIRYVVRWGDRSGEPTGVTAGQPSATAYPFDDSLGCPGGGAELELELSSEDADRVPGGVYSSTLTITLSAE